MKKWSIIKGEVIEIVDMNMMLESEVHPRRRTYEELDEENLDKVKELKSFIIVNTYI